MRFRNRYQAGQELAQALSHYKNRDNALVMALPRGGVPVAAEIAKALELPLDVILVKKLGLPGQEELAMGAISTGGHCVLNKDTLRFHNVTQGMIDYAISRKQTELNQLTTLLPGEKPFPELKGKTVIVVDDGLATGATMKAAVQAVAAQKAQQIIVAVPVGSPDICAELATLTAETVCLHRPYPFGSVGHWYADFTQVSSKEVRDLLQPYM